MNLIFAEMNKNLDENNDEKIYVFNPSLNMQAVFNTSTKNVFNLVVDFLYIENNDQIGLIFFTPNITNNYDLKISINGGVGISAVGRDGNPLPANSIVENQINYFTIKDNKAVFLTSDIGNIKSLKTNAKNIVDAINEVGSGIPTDITSIIGDVKQLKTNAKVIVPAINEVKDGLDSLKVSVGDSSQLQTTAKNIVPAINEVNIKSNTAVATANSVKGVADNALNIANTASSTASGAKITADAAKLDIGTKSSLTTYNKTNLVGAINEVNAKTKSIDSITDGTASLTVIGKGAGTDHFIFSRNEFPGFGLRYEISSMKKENGVVTGGAVLHSNTKLAADPNLTSKCRLGEWEYPFSSLALGGNINDGNAGGIDFIPYNNGGQIGQIFNSHISQGDVNANGRKERCLNFITGFGFGLSQWINTENQSGAETYFAPGHTVTNTYLGDSTHLFSKIYCYSGTINTSDKNCKSEVKYIDTNTSAKKNRKASSELIRQDFYDFVKSDLKIASYKLWNGNIVNFKKEKEDDPEPNVIEENAIGFIAQDVIGTKMEKILIHDEGKGSNLGFNANNFSMILANALQESICQVENLKIEVSTLKTNMETLELQLQEYKTLEERVRMLENKNA